MQQLGMVQQRRRSGFLTAYLILWMIIDLLSALGLLLVQSTPETVAASGMPAWAITANLIEAVLYLLLLVGVWLWMRWAVIGLVLLTAVDLVLTAMSGRPLTDALVSVGFLLLLLVLARPVWQQMR